MTNKSINASEGQETPIIDVFMEALAGRFVNYFGSDPPVHDFHGNNGYDSGVNPQDSIETQVLK